METTSLRHSIDFDREIGSAARVAVSAIMTTPAIRVTPETTLESIADIFLDRAISAVPVVDDAGRPLGMVSKTDLVRETRLAAENLEVETVAGPEPGMHVERIARSTAGEIMTPVVFSVPAATPIATAAALMAYEHVHRVPVLGEQGQVVGIVSSLDVLQWLAARAGFVVPRRSEPAAR